VHPSPPFCSSTNQTQIPSLTILFLLTSPRPQLLHFPGVPHILFPSYTKPELLLILALVLPTPLPSGEKDTRETHTRFLSAVYDSLSKHSGRDLASFQHVAAQLWPRFIRPVLSGELSPTPFSRLLLAKTTLSSSQTLSQHPPPTPKLQPKPLSQKQEKHTSSPTSSPFTPVSSSSPRISPLTTPLASTSSSS
jgi:origin recognition complex subunit 5